MTCGHCGQIKKVGSDKIYSCNHCGYVVDRDIHGARNICIKTITQKQD
jgi:putative transposase